MCKSFTIMTMLVTTDKSIRKTFIIIIIINIVVNKKTFTSQIYFTVMLMHEAKLKLKEKKNTNFSLLSSFSLSFLSFWFSFTHKHTHIHQSSRAPFFTKLVIKSSSFQVRYELSLKTFNPSLNIITNLLHMNSRIFSIGWRCAWTADLEDVSLGRILCYENRKPYTATIYEKIILEHSMIISTLSLCAKIVRHDYFCCGIFLTFFSQ